jgi:hypothetical protein
MSVPTISENKASSVHYCPHSAPVHEACLGLLESWETLSILDLTFKVTANSEEFKSLLNC